MKAEFLNSNYIQSQSIVVQGKKDFQNAIKRGFVEKSGGNGTYRMYKPSEAKVFFKVGESVKKSSVKDLIRKTYNVRNVTQKSLEKFCDDWQSGRLEVSYSEETGLYI